MSWFKKIITQDYPPLCVHYLHYILKCGMILDEDMNIVLSNCIEIAAHSDEPGLPLIDKICGVCSIASTAYMLYDKSPIYLALISATPIVVICLTRLRDVFYHKKRMQDLEVTVETVKNIAKLNRMILDYFRMKRLYDPNTADIVNPYTSGMRKLIETVSEEELTVLYKFQFFIRQFGSYVPYISIHYAYLEKLELDLSTADVNTVNDGYYYLEQVCDIYVLLASNYLTCLSLVLCPNILAKYNVDTDEVVTKIVPKMKTVLLNCYNAVKKRFDDVKYYYLKRDQDKNMIEKPKPNAATKLQMNAYNTMMHTTDIVEKSKIIYKNILEVDLQNFEEKENLEKCIAELRSNVYDYYESLDILLKMFQVKMKVSQDKPPASHFEIPKTDNSDSDIKEDASLNPVEPTEDEEYELYIGANEPTSYESTDRSSWEEENRLYATVLCQELKQKLKTHSQFIAARRKRGIVEEEPKETPAEDELPPIVVPRLNFEEIAAQEGDLLDSTTPPPPPPLPLIDIDPAGGDQGPSLEPDDFLEEIRRASRNRNNVVEVFGSDLDDEVE